MRTLELYVIHLLETAPYGSPELLSAVETALDLGLDTEVDSIAKRRLTAENEEFATHWPAEWQIPPHSKAARKVWQARLDRLLVLKDEAA